MKKLVIVLFCLLLLLQLFSCTRDPATDDEALTVVCTSFVVADWVEELVGDRGDIEIKILCDDGKDMHNFQPSAADMKAVLTSDLFIYIGGESDKWAEKIDRNAAATIRLFDVVEGIYCEEAKDTHDGHHHDSPDEHIWLSFENALACVSEIANMLCRIDAENSYRYTASLLEYEGRVRELYTEYKSAAETAKYKTLVFADRFPFVYLVNELGLEYAAAFPGCSSETSASFETVISLARKVDECGLPYVVVLEDSADRIADTVINNTESKTAKVIELDSMQIYRAAMDFDYLEAMGKNLYTLKLVLGCE